jgi:hypothetical protein
MNCSDFTSRLTQAIESRDDEARARLAAHLDGCGSPACRALWDECQLVSQAVEVWMQQRPRPPKLAGPVLRRIEAERRSGSWSVRRPEGRRGPGGARWAAITIAAGLLVAAGFLIRPAPDLPRIAKESLEPGGRVVPAHRPPATSVAQPSVAQPSVAQPSAAEAQAPRGEAYIGIAHEATYFVTDLAMLVVPVDIPPPEDADSSPGWIHRLEEQLEPVKTGVEGKLGEWFGLPAT